MTFHEEIDNLLNKGISIIAEEMKNIQTNQKTEALNKFDSDKVTEFLKTLVTIRKDWRIAEKEQAEDTKELSQEELENKIVEEAQKILNKRNETK